MAARDEQLTIDEAVVRLQRLGRDVRRRRGRRWLAQCPAHDDNRHSLSLKEGDRVVLLVKCFAGCAFEEVMTVLEGKRPPVPLSGRSGPKRRRARQIRGRVQWYDYRDEAGRLLYQHGRTPEKQFPFRMPPGGAVGDRPQQGGRTGQRWGLAPGVRRVLYRLPALAGVKAGSSVFVVEGEKDADRLASLGLVATSNDNGAGKWPEGCDHHFEGLHVVVLPDNDAAGEAHGEMVATRLAAVAASVRVVRLPGLPEKGDVSDWLDAGHSREDLLLQSGLLAGAGGGRIMREPVSGYYPVACSLVEHQCFSSSGRRR